MLKKALVILTITAALVLTASVIALAEGARQQVFQSRAAPESRLTAAPRAILQEEEPPAGPQRQRGERPAATSTTVLESRAPAEALAVSLQGIGGGPFQTSLFFDDMESGTGNWTATGLWHGTTVTDTFGQSYNGQGSAWYGQPASGDYNTGGANSGALIAGPLTLPVDAPGVYLRYFSYEYTEDFLDEFDTRKVYTSTDAVDWSLVFTSTESTAAWHEVQVDLSASRGQSLYVKFEFDTQDDSFNDYPGWYIDDVAIGYDDIHVNNQVQIDYTLPGELTSFPDSPYRSMQAYNFTEYTATFTATLDSSFFGGVFPLGELSPGTPIFVSASGFVTDTAALGSSYDNYVYYTATTITETFTNWQLGRTLLGKLEGISYQIYDDGRGQTQGNGNGLIDPGETISVTVDLQNYFDIAHHEVTAGFGPATYVSWLDSLDVVGDFPAGVVISNTQYLFAVSSSTPRGEVVTLTLNTTARGGLAFTTLFTETVPYVLDLGTDRLNAAPPGETMTYTLELSNGTGADDAFDLSVLTGTWTTTFSADPTVVVTDGLTTSVEVYVEVPPGADWGDMDPITIQAQGVGPSTGYTDTVLLNSYAGLKLEGSSPTVNGTQLNRAFPVQPFAAYIYIFSSDDDTLDGTLEGFNPATQAWETIASQLDGGSGVLINGPLPAGYAQVRVRLVDTDFNDDIYFDYLLVHAPSIGLDPIDQGLLGVPGSVVTYTQQLSNLTGGSYSYSLTATQNSWPTYFLSGTQVISYTPVLSDGQSFTYTVAVEIPADPGGVLTDTAVLYASEAQDITYTTTAYLRSLALGQEWVLGYADQFDPSAVLFDAIDGSDPTTLSTGRVQKDQVSVSAFSHDGATAAAWVRYYTNGQGYGVSEVVVALVDASGSLLWGPQQVADYAATTYEIYDEYPSVAIDPVSGNVGLVWQHYDYNNPNFISTYNIHAAVLDPQGNYVLPPTPLTNNQISNPEDYNPVIEAPRSGGFVVVWEHWPASTGDDSFYSMALDSQGGTRRAASELLATMDYLEPYDPRLVRLQDDRLLLLYSCYSYLTDISDVCAAPLDRNGGLADDPQNLTQLTQDPEGNVYADVPDAVQLASGEVVVGWVQSPGPAYHYLVLGSDLSNQTPPTPLDTGPVALEEYLLRLSLAQDSYGRAVFAYTNQAAGQMFDEQSVYLGVINADGSQAGAGLYREPQGATTQLSYKGQAAGGMTADPPLYYKYLPTIVKTEPEPTP